LHRNCFGIKSNPFAEKEHFVESLSNARTALKFNISLRVLAIQDSQGENFGIHSAGDQRAFFNGDHPKVVCPELRERAQQKIDSIDAKIAS
jgi:hypothetical protein